MSSLRSQARFARRYSQHLLARIAPRRAVPPSWILPWRFRYRVLLVSADDIRWKPGVKVVRGSSRVAEEELLRRMAAWFALQGDWDVAPRRFELHPVVRELIVEGVPVRESQAYRDMMAAISRGDAIAARNCKDEAEVVSRLEGLGQIYRSMAIHGYRSQLQMGRPPVDEMTVCIGRTGQLMLLRFGNHRLSMAKLLGIPRVPAVVRGVHSGWVHDWMLRIGTRDPVQAVTHGLEQISRR